MLFYEWGSDKQLKEFLFSDKDIAGPDRIDFIPESILENPWIKPDDKKVYTACLEKQANGMQSFPIEYEKTRFEFEQEKPQNRKQIDGYVYLIRIENGLYKIGKAKNIDERIKPFKVSFPMSWEIIHAFMSHDYSKAEITLHERFSDKRTVGEWFTLDEQDVQSIKSIKDWQL
jgi:hypothetical protein